MRVEFEKRQAGCSHIEVQIELNDGGKLRAEISGILAEPAVDMMLRRLRKEFDEQFMSRPAKLMSVAQAVQAGLIKGRSSPLSIEAAVEMGIILQPVAALGEVVSADTATWYARAWRWVVGLWPF